jgi:hypothetical protein
MYILFNICLLVLQRNQSGFCHGVLGQALLGTG